MSEHSEHEVETRFTGDDSPLQAAIGRIVGGAKRVNHAFDHASEVLGGLASVAAVVGGGFSLERAVDSTKEYLSSIDRISRLTGESVSDTDGLLEALEKVGLEGDSAERIFLGISRKTANAEQHMNALGQATGTTGQMMKHLGVDLKNGPVASLEQMATAVQKGKLGAGELGMAFGIPRTQVVGLMELLQRGPKYIHESVIEARKYGVTVADLSSFKQMQNAQREIGAAWKRINVIIGSELMPLVASWLKDGADKMRGWVEHAREYGKVLHHWLQDHYQLVLRIGKVLLANYALQKATGSGIGGIAGRAVGGAFGFVKRGFASGVYQVAQGPARGGVLGVFDTLMSHMGILRGVVFGLGRLTLVGTVVAAIYGMFVAIKDNVAGIRTYFLDLWGRITERFAGMKLALQPILNAFSSNGTIGKFFTDTMVKVIHGLGGAVEWLLKTLHTLINVMSIINEEGLHAFDSKMHLWQQATKETENQMAMARDMERYKKAKEAQESARQTPTQRERQPYYDFRGSRFDIKQAFADVDPDRIAVAFANSLGALGERRVQSSFAPLWSI